MVVVARPESELRFDNRAAQGEPSNRIAETMIENSRNFPSSGNTAFLVPSISATPMPPSLTSFSQSQSMTAPLLTTSSIDGALSYSDNKHHPYPPIPLRQRDLPASFWQEPNSQTRQRCLDHLAAAAAGLSHTSLQSRSSTLSGSSQLASNSFLSSSPMSSSNSHFLPFLALYPDLMLSNTAFNRYVRRPSQLNPAGDLASSTPLNRLKGGTLNSSIGDAVQQNGRLNPYSAQRTQSRFPITEYLYNMYGSKYRYANPVVLQQTPPLSEKTWDDVRIKMIEANSRSNTHHSTEANEKLNSNKNSKHDDIVNNPINSQIYLKRRASDNHIKSLDDSVLPLLSLQSLQTSSSSSSPTDKNATIKTAGTALSERAADFSLRLSDCYKSSTKHSPHSRLSDGMLFDNSVNDSDQLNNARCVCCDVLKDSCPNQPKRNNSNSLSQTNNGTSVSTATNDNATLATTNNSSNPGELGFLPYFQVFPHLWPPFPPPLPPSASLSLAATATARERYLPDNIYAYSNQERSIRLMRPRSTLGARYHPFGDVR
ncbi:uncharacterized protein LOC128249600 [Octopus bimaculoides]|nr:uncharacterized protein LOC128249600 [Octopus bimaculoides]